MIQKTSETRFCSNQNAKSPWILVACLFNSPRPLELKFFTCRLLQLEFSIRHIIAFLGNFSFSKSSQIFIRNENTALSCVSLQVSILLCNFDFDFINAKLSKNSSSLQRDGTSTILNNGVPILSSNKQWHKHNKMQTFYLKFYYQKPNH